MTKICVFGAGAIGGYMAAMIAKSGEADVSVIARGAHLAAIKKNGLRLRKGGEDIVTHPVATDNPHDLGPQDFVIVAVKAHTMSEIVEAMQPLLGADTTLVFAVNGIPWWYFYEFAGPLHDYKLQSVDPDGRIWDGLGPSRAVGCVVYPAAIISEPGVITHVEGDRFTLGEPNGERSDRIKTLSRILIASGLKAPVRPRIRDEIWIKLWGNCSFNPISVLTHATLADICDDPGVRQVAYNIMAEAQAVGEALGVVFPIDIDKRMEGAEAIGAHKTSMLQDLERGRAMELDAVVTAVQELARLVKVETPVLDMILALTQMRAKKAQQL